MKLSHLLVAASVCLFWGLNAVAAKVGVTWMPPIFFTSLRFLALVVLLAPWLRIAPVRGQWRVLVPAVVFMGALHFALIFTGVKFATAWPSPVSCCSAWMVTRACNGWASRFS
jgi:O-acetylserine/cysteine efflux transporter